MLWRSRQDPPLTLSGLPCRGSHAWLVRLGYTSEIVSWSWQDRNGVEGASMLGHKYHLLCMVLSVETCLCSFSMNRRDP